jgi:hypothetical protein
MGGPLERGGRSGAVARIAVVPGTGGIGVVGLQRRASSLQATALARCQRGGHGLPDEDRARSPNPAPEPEQAGRGQPGQGVEGRTRVEARRRRHDPGGGLPGEQRDERQDLSAHAGLPLARRRTARRCPCRPTSRRVRRRRRPEGATGRPAP